MYSNTENLRKLRLTKGLTQQRIADLLQMEQTTYAKIELGKSRLRPEVAIKLAEILETKISNISTFPFEILPICNTNDLPKISIDSNFDNDLQKKIIFLLVEIADLLKYKNNIS